MEQRENMEKFRKVRGKTKSNKSLFAFEHVTA